MDTRKAHPISASQRMLRNVLPLVALAFVLGASELALGADFVLKDGKRLRGELLYVSQSALVIREANGAVQQLSRRALDLVEIKTRKHGRLSGTLVSWSEGLYRIQTEDKVFDVKGRRVLAQAPRETKSAETSEAKAPEPVETVASEAAPAAGSNDAAVLVEQEADPRQDAKADQTEAKASAEKPKTKQEPATDVAKVIISAEDQSEEAAAIVFELSLSAAVAKEVLLIYATADGSARAEADFEPLSGAVILKPGSAATKISVPLLDDNLAEGAETFDLLVTSDLDPDQVTIERVPVTILDNETTTARN